MSKVWAEEDEYVLDEEEKMELFAGVIQLRFNPNLGIKIPVRADQL